MKARKLIKLLNNTTYRVEDHGEYIGIGSSLCHDLIKLEKQPLKLSYALNYLRNYPGGVSDYEYLKDSIREDKPESSENELFFIFDTLKKLIESGEIKDIIFGKDEIENQLPVFTYNKGNLIETSTDSWELPNLTIDGERMYSNTHFKTKKGAVIYGIKEEETYIKILQEQIKEMQDKLDERNNRLIKCRQNIINLKSIDIS